MSSMKILLTLALLAALAVPVTATAANQPHPKLDAIASEVAGYPASVHCEGSLTDWMAIAQPGEAGFVYWNPTTGKPEPVAYIAPRECFLLRQALDQGYRSLGLTWPELLARGLLVLLHESVHLRGVQDEGETDCTALRMVKTYAVRWFGVPAKVTRVVTVYRWRTVNGKRVRVKVRVKRLVANPALQQMYDAALYQHLRLPPEYHGDCLLG